MSERQTPDEPTPEGVTPDELDRLIDGLLDGADTPQDVAQGDALMDAARQIRDLAESIPADVRNRHLAAIRAAAADPAPAMSAAGWLPTLRRRAAAIAAATTLAFGTAGGGAVALAQDANPGDPLYGVKRVSENVALAVTSDDARLHLQFADRRLDELEAVPGHAPELASAAAQQLHLAQKHGADLGEAGAQAVARLSELVGSGQLGSENAEIAVSRACDRIATRHGHTPDDCDYDPDHSPGKSGEAPGRSGDGPGNSGDPQGRSDGAPAGRDDIGTSGDEGNRPDGAGPPDGVPGPDADTDAGD